MGKLLLLVVVGLGIMVIVKIAPNSAAWREQKEFMASYCRANQQKMNLVLRSWFDAGVAARYRGSDLDVEDDRWTMASHDGKVSIGLALYCRGLRQSSSSATTTVYIWGYRDGAIKATVMDGSYFD